jgi:FAD/FMN-containing dehydrogenase
MQNTDLEKFLINDLKLIVGNENLLIDERSREFNSTDLFFSGRKPLAIITPTNLEELREIITLLYKNNIAMIPKGGGLSYSSGYISNEINCVLIDTKLLNNIIEINKEDMYVTVQCGITWKKLNKELSQIGYRTPFWGPGSGKFATVGGSLSQNALNYGSGKFGFASQSVISLDVITNNGNIIKTGSAGTKEYTPPYLRHYGPDLTGLFLGDSGSLGIKSRITLQLIKKPKKTVYASYEIDDRETFCNCLSNISREYIVSECFGFDPKFTEMRTTYKNISDGIKKLTDVIKAEDTLTSGLTEAIKIINKRDKFLKNIKYSIHITIDGNSNEELTLKLKRIDDLISEDIKKMESTIPRIMRSNPFPDPTILLSHHGERWIPTHGIVPHSKLIETTNSIYNYFESNKIILNQHRIKWAVTLIPAGLSAMLIEPNIYWEDEVPEMVQSYLPNEYFKNQKKYSKNIKNKELVSKIREDLINIFHEYQGSHMQIGRFYPYLTSRDKEIKSLLYNLKEHLDPKNLINPGSLNFLFEND